MKRIKSLVLAMLILMTAGNSIIYAAVVENEEGTVFNPTEISIEDEIAVNQKTEAEEGTNIDATDNNEVNFKEELTSTTNEATEEIEKTDTNISEELEANVSKEAVDESVEETEFLVNSDEIPRSMAAQPRYVGQVIVENSIDGTSMNFMVLEQDAATKTGIVQVGSGKAGLDGVSTNGNGLNVYPINGVLEIPSTITYNGYTYTVTTIGEHALSTAKIKKITFPSTLTTIKKNSLVNNDFEILEIPEGVTLIEYMALAKNAKLKVLKLPTTIRALGSAIIQNCTKLSTIYFPLDNVVVDVASGVSSNAPLYGMIQDSVIIVETQEQYDKWASDATIISNSKALSEQMISLETEVEFYDKNLNKLNIPPLKKLLYKNIAYSKLPNGEWVYPNVTWSVCTDMPALPSEAELGYTAKYWGVNDIGIATIDSKGKIKESNISGSGGHGNYFNVVDKKIIALEEELKTVAVGADKEYDGESEFISMSFNRKLDNDFFQSGLVYASIFISNPTGAAGGGYRYTSFPALLGTTYSSTTLRAGFTNVADSGVYTYKIIVYDKLTKKNLTDPSYQAVWFTHPAGGVGYPVTVDIRPATITINPTLDSTEIAWINQDQLPTIKLGAKDTKGTITWDANQTPELGTKEYSYTFIPENLYADGIKGNNIANFTETEKKGSITITYKVVVPPTPSPTIVPTVAPEVTPIITPKPKPTVTPAVSETPTVSPEVTTSPETTVAPTTEVSKLPSIENKEDGVVIESADQKNIFDKEEKVYLVDSADVVKKEAEQLLENIIRVFDIVLEVDGVKVDKITDSKIRITLEAKDYADYNDLKVYQKSKDGKYSELNYEQKDGKIIFECDALDTYVLTGTKSPFPWWIVVVASIIAGIIIIVIVKKKNKKDEN